MKQSWTSEKISKVRPLDSKIVPLGSHPTLIKRNLKPRYTDIQQVLDFGDGLVIMEAFGRYPLEQANVYKVDYAFDVIWIAEKPVGGDFFIPVMTVNADSTASHAFAIHCKSWFGYDCLIDPDTGTLAIKNPEIDPFWSGHKERKT
jgi:hypothetical protein